MRLSVDLTIKVPFEISDTGYTSNMTLPEIEKWAKDKMRSVQVLLKEGGQEPTLVPARATINVIRFSPNG